MPPKKKKSVVQKARGSWGAVKPTQKPHSTPKGKRGYTRPESKKAIEDNLNDLSQKQKPGV